MPDPVPYTEEFEKKVWGPFPRRDGVKKGKRPGFEKFRKLPRSSQIDVIEDIRKRNEQGGWGKYIRDLITYLNQSGWEDEWIGSRPVTNPHKIDIPEQEGPRQTCPVKIMLNQRFLEYIRDHYGLNKSYARADYPLTKQHIRDMLRVRDQFVEPIREAWERKESLTGMREALLEHWDSIHMEPSNA